jgi:hypothetical protein
MERAGNVVASTIQEREDDKAYVKEILDDAMDVTADYQMHNHLAWTTLFAKAVELLNARRRSDRVVLTDTDKYVHAAEKMLASIESKTSVGLLDLVASRLRLDRAVVADVFDDSDGTIDVIVTPRKLDPTKARATKQLALLVVAARQAAELEEWTDVDEIRRLVEDYKKYDSANFASAIKEMHDDFRIKQVGRKITVKLGRPGWDRAAELVRKLAGEE